MDIKCNIRNYLGENCNRFFKIPAYQRGYKWGVPRKRGPSDAVALLESIICAMNSGKEEYFIHGITGYEDGTDDIVLIDGQQRTTALFLLLNILMTPEEKNKFLFHNSTFKLKYEIRTSSQSYLENICRGVNATADAEHNTQDIFYFNKTREEMEDKLKKVGDRQALKEYILSKVVLFFIDIPKNRAADVFSMMNGARAFMKTDELIKAEFLCKASDVESHPAKVKNISETMDVLRDKIGEEWEVNALRSMYARQWDKWLYWWNKPEVRAFFRTGNNPMGLLLEFFFEQKGGMQYSNEVEDAPEVFKAFQNLLLQDMVAAKRNFELLRKLQKKFEDLFSIPHLYNHLGMTLNMIHDKKNAVRFFLDSFKDKNRVRQYALLALVDLPDKEIRNVILLSPKNSERVDAIDKAKGKIQDMLRMLGECRVYKVHDEHAYRQLFRLNVEAANDRHVKFEFFITDEINKKNYNFYDGRSLEHIWPKSRVIYTNLTGQSCALSENGKEEVIIGSNKPDYLHRNDFNKECSEHCIGNLVFLHKNDNSKFNAKLPEDKKTLYFDLNKELFSRNLLHTMSVFAYSRWDCGTAIKNIQDNRISVLDKIKKGYTEYE